jgi:hypothetical protein
MDAQALPSVLPYLETQSEKRLVLEFQKGQLWLQTLKVAAQPALYEARNLMAHAVEHERNALRTAANFAGGGTAAEEPSIRRLESQAAALDEQLKTSGFLRGAKFVDPAPPWEEDASAKRVPIRIDEFGPLTYQNDDVLVARLGRERVSKIKLLSGAVSHQLQAEDLPELYAYEIVNFVDGKRSVGEIRDAVAAEFGPIAVDVVEDYLEACKEAGVIAWK